jgi:hypothetical protein
MAYKLAGIVAILYGLVAITGGAVGAHKISIPGLPLEAKDASNVSLYAGGGCGLLLILCGIGLLRGSKLAAWGALAVALIVMAARPIPGLIDNMNNLSGFLETTKGKVSLTMVFGGLLTILFTGLALLQSKQTSQTQTQG